MVNAALFSWPVITAILAFRLKWPLVVLVSIFGGYLFLPTGFGIDFPLLPKFDKDTIPSLTLIILAFLLRPGQINGLLPEAIPRNTVNSGFLPATWIGLILIFLWSAGAILTALSNGDTLVYGGRIIPGLRLYDGFASIMSSVSMILPLLLGRKYFAHTDRHRLLLVFFTVAALVYSLLALYEIRMSPQLNRMLYGFFPHSWHQHVRSDGFRPVVFLSHGLNLALFFCMGILAAIGLYRISDIAKRKILLLSIGWLFLTLALSKSLGSLSIAIAIAPAAFFFPIRLRLLVAAAIGILVLSYPAARFFDLVPTTKIISWAEGIDPARAQSFAFRVDNENDLLAHAAERPLFGWGGWGRNRVFDETGNDTSTTDGGWILAFGKGGWVEYLTTFGLLALPCIILAFRGRSWDVSSATAGLCLVLAANMLDLLPNNGQSPVTWLIAGALLGRLELGKETKPANDCRVENPRRPHRSITSSSPGLAYTRQAQRHTRAGKA